VNRREIEDMELKPSASIDARLPPDMAERAEHVGAEKAALDALTLLALAVLAGAFIAFGAMFSTIASATVGAALPFGAERVLAGIAFSLGLVLVVVGGAELFTGDNLMVMAWAGGRVTLGKMLRAWALVYVGNFIGAAATAALVFLAGHYALGDGAIGAVALATADAKAALQPFTAIVRGILANVLVCLAVWLSYGAGSATDKVMVIVPPIAAFVAAGFEHSIANMYILPFGLMIKYWAPASFWSLIGHGPGDYAALDWSALATNLVPVTIGNIIGGGFLVGAVYWFVYLRKRPLGGA